MLPFPVFMSGQTAQTQRRHKQPTEPSQRDFYSILRVDRKSPNPSRLNKSPKSTRYSIHTLTIDNSRRPERGHRVEGRTFTFGIKRGRPRAASGAIFGAALLARAKRDHCSDFSLAIQHCISNHNIQELESSPTYRKQTSGSTSNRNKFGNSPRERATGRRVCLLKPCLKRKVTGFRVLSRFKRAKGTIQTLTKR